VPAAEAFVFISYPGESEDRAFVDALSSALRDHGVESWYDKGKGGIPVGADWEAVVRDRLARAARVVGIFTRNSLRKDNTNRPYYASEINRAINSKRLAPVILDGLEPDDLRLGTDTFEWVAMQRGKLDDGEALTKLVDGLKQSVVAGGATVGIHEEPYNYLAMLIDCREQEQLLRDNLLEKVKVAEARVATFVILTDECKADHALWKRFEQDYVRDRLPGYTLDSVYLAVAGFPQGKPDALLQRLGEERGIDQSRDVRQGVLEGLRSDTVLALNHESELNGQTMKGLEAWLTGWRAAKLPAGSAVVLWHKIQLSGPWPFKRSRVAALRDLVTRVFGECGAVIDEPKGIVREDGDPWLQTMKARKRAVYVDDNHYGIERELNQFFKNSRRSDMPDFVVHFGEYLKSLGSAR
jgi:TIR domain-containing protein